MPIDITTPGSPGWWLAKCARKLEERRPRLQELHDIMSGDSPWLREQLDHKFSDAYKEFREESGTNYADLTVQSLRRRAQIRGFRTPLTQGTGSDADAQRVWDDNGMSIELDELLDNMLGMGDSYAILGLEEGAATITAEDPREVVTIHDPIRQRIVRAGAKITHHDDDDLDVAFLHRPGRMWKATKPRKTRNASIPPKFSSAWEWDEDYGGEEGTATSCTRVLIVRFRWRRGVSLFEPHIRVLRRLDRQTFRRDVIASMQAFRQIAAFNTPDDDDDGNKIDWDKILIFDPGAIWRLPEGVDLKQLDSVDLTPLNSSIDSDLRKYAAVSSTPLTVFFPDAAQGSAEGASLMADQQVANANELVRRANETVRDMLSIAFELEGDPVRSDRASIEVRWASTQRRSLAEMADAESKSQSIPFGTRARKIWDWPEEDIQGAEAERAADALEAAAFQQMQMEMVDGGA